MIQIFPQSSQAKGSFNFGRILEHKPIGFPQDGGALKPYSTLFYWAHAWSDEGGLIDQHPHKGFEIMSYVLLGEIRHYDNQLNGWKKLVAGDVQVIRAGSGIVHAEQLMPGSAMYQIWFDPNLQETLTQDPSYNDYPSRVFPVTRQQGIGIKHICGGGSPFQIRSKVDFIQEWSLKGESRTMDLEPRSIYSVCVISGTAGWNGKSAEAGDFIVITEEKELKVEGDGRFLVIGTPKDPGFDTYYRYMTR
ncbi:MAG: pirin family protein [Bacteroidia bacterium]|nr:pirin family protein [Bacteroidia bacterium]